MSPRRVADGAAPLLDRAEPAVAGDVAGVLADIAAEFAQEVQDADSLTAAVFSVRRITGMWTSRVPNIMRSLLSVYEQAGGWLATGMGGTLPDDWTGLPAQYDQDPARLPQPVQDFLTSEQTVMDLIGDHLGQAAREALAEGLDAGDTPEQLTQRILAAFNTHGPQLGETRAQRIARTEAQRAWNRAALDAAHALPADLRPTVKQWRTRDDTRVRSAHRHANGQIQLLDDPFTVGGVAMATPGDPTAPPAQCVNCRCTLAFAPTRDDLRSEGAGNLSAAQIEVTLVDEFSDRRNEGEVTASAGGHTGAMIALVPSAADADRLALVSTGSEPADELHLTLFYLGEGADWDTQHRADLVAGLRSNFADADTIAGRAFGANQWNADGDEPCWVWSVGDDRETQGPSLEGARWAATQVLQDMRRQPELPAQHSPWQPHLAAAYTRSPALLTAMNQRLGPIRFDRLRVAFAGEVTDIPLGPDKEATMPDQTTNATTTQAPRTWSTPGRTALAFENQETGDGRIFARNSLFWEPGPLPMQFAEEMLSGHEGARLAGAINSISRDGDRIPGSGVLYPGQDAGADAITLHDQGAPLGVSVDLDDVDMEFIDRTISDGDTGGLMLAASLPSASVMRLEDGGWIVRATAPPEWTASGTSLLRTHRTVELATGPDGTVPLDAVRAALTNAGVTVTAAAGDPDDPSLGEVVHSQKSGDMVMRITRARVRGATLVAMPAYSQACIVLDPPAADEIEQPDMALAAAAGGIHEQIVTYVCSSPIPVGARHVSKLVGIAMSDAQRHLTRAAKAGRIVRLAPGKYVGASTIPEGPQGDLAAALPGELVDQEDDTDMTELEASAWTAMQDLPPMPAEWFNEPTAEELPPGSGGVHYAAGRVYGWVAQAGVPHAGYPGKHLTIDKLAREGLDFSHFLRTEFELDDGTFVRVGAMTMNVGHNGDGAHCNDAVCQFDNSGTVGAIVTVGMSKGGLWFAGAGGPWLSDWDKRVFRTCQPSYHLKARKAGGWELRAVLDVPVPGHSSPLVAAVIERSNLALAASAAIAEDTAPEPDTATDVPDTPPAGDMTHLAAAIVASPTFIDSLAAALDQRRLDQEKTRAEIDLLTQQLAPARVDVAATMAAQLKGDN